MSASTASVADVSRTQFINKDQERGRRNSGQSQTQCTPIPLPALGTQRIIQGNGTSIGTVISLQCPDKHKLMGEELKCVLGPNSTHWVGETYCKPLSPYEIYGFRVAVLASIVSSAIICFMSVAFITCCLLDCIREEEMKEQEGDPDVWQWDEQQENNRSRQGHKGRNNNNNNTQEKLCSLWDTSISANCDNTQACRDQQEYAYHPACTCGSSPLLFALPGCDYDQPLVSRNQEYAQTHPSQYVRRPPSSFQGTHLGPDSLMWQYGGHQTGLSDGNSQSTDESSRRNVKKDFSIRIISV